MHARSYVDGVRLGITFSRGGLLKIYIVYYIEIYTVHGANIFTDRSNFNSSGVAGTAG